MAKVEIMLVQAKKLHFVWALSWERGHLARPW